MPETAHFLIQTLHVLAIIFKCRKLHLLIAKQFVFLLLPMTEIEIKEENKKKNEIEEDNCSINISIR